MLGIGQKRHMKLVFSNQYYGDKLEEAVKQEGGRYHFVGFLILKIDLAWG